CVPADEKIGPGDRYIVAELANYPRAKLVAIVTKIDKVPKARVAEALLAVAELADWAEIIPVSALTQEQLDVVRDELIALLPESPPLYSQETLTEESDEARIAELIREAALEGVE